MGDLLPRVDMKNITTSFKCDSKLELEKLKAIANLTFFLTKKLTLKLKTGSTAMFHRNGLVTTTGSKTEAQACGSISACLGIVHKAYPQMKASQSIITSYQGSVRLPFKLNLKALADAEQHCVRYNVDTYNMCRIFFAKNNVSCSLYATGMLSITGKSWPAVLKAAQEVYYLAQPFDKLKYPSYLELPRHRRLYRKWSHILNNQPVVALSKSLNVPLTNKATSKQGSSAFTPFPSVPLLDLM